MSEDRTLNELTELLRTATASAEGMVDQWGLEGEYMSLELINTIKKASKLLKILDEEKAITEI
jgi:hypothetical protein